MFLVQPQHLICFIQHLHVGYVYIFHLNVFLSQSLLFQDVCIIEKIEKNSTICVRPLDRVHPYPYLYAGFSKPTEWIPITSSRIEPYLSRVRRPLPRDATEYDLVDVKDLKTGQYHVAEVYGNIGSALWVLAVNNYRSAEHKDNLREWICSSSKRLVRYRGSHAPRSVYNRLLPINQTINMVQPNNNNDMRVEQYVPLTISDRYSYMVVAEDTSKKSHILHLSDL